MKPFIIGADEVGRGSFAGKYPDYEIAKNSPPTNARRSASNSMNLSSSKRSSLHWQNEATLTSMPWELTKPKRNVTWSVSSNFMMISPRSLWTAT